MNEQENLAIRAELEAEIFDGVKPQATPAEPVDDQPEPAQIAEPEVEQDGAEPADPWEGIPDVVKKQFETLQSRVSTVDSLAEKLKQAEGRIGYLQSQAAKAAKAAEENPTPKNIEAAKKSTEKWEKLSKELPEITEAVQEILEAQKDARPKFNPDPINKEIAELRLKLDKELRQTQLDFLSYRHPDWEAKHSSTEFQTWLQAQSDEIKNASMSPYARDAIKVLDEFDKTTKKQSPAVIADKRKQRLEQAQTVKTGKRIMPQKTWEEMSQEERRASVAKELGYGS